MRFKFRGKTGKEWRLKVSDRRIARIVRSCQELPGQHLFQYEDDEGEVRQVTSADVNDVPARDRRRRRDGQGLPHLGGTVLWPWRWRRFRRVDSEAAAKRNVRRAIEAVAGRLGNTATICRKCYIHPEVLNCYLEGDFAANFKMREEEAEPQ